MRSRVSGKVTASSEGDYLKKMKETADAYRLPRGLIDLELTETSFIDFKTKETRTNARHIIDELKAYGYTTSSTIPYAHN